MREYKKGGCMSEQKVFELTNKRRLEIALKLLEKVSDNWNNADVVNYPQELSSFDEVVTTLKEIRLK